MRFSNAILSKFNAQADELLKFWDTEVWDNNKLNFKLKKGANLREGIQFKAVKSSEGIKALTSSQILQQNVVKRRTTPLSLWR